MKLALGWKTHSGWAALIRAAHCCGLQLYEVNASQLMQLEAEGEILPQLTRLGRELGPPWGMDQKDATRGAYIALHRH